MYSAKSAATTNKATAVPIRASAEPGTLYVWVRVIRAEAAKQMLTSTPALVMTTVLR